MIIKKGYKQNGKAFSQNGSRRSVDCCLKLSARVGEKSAELLKYMIVLG